MPVFRFRDHEEARTALWLPAGSPALAREWLALYQLSLLAPAAAPRRGVYKFRTIEEANQDADAWTGKRIRAGRARISRERGRTIPR